MRVVADYDLDRPQVQGQRCPQPSGTNDPKAFRIVRLSRVSSAESAEGYFWWLWRRCPPLPIPNREVKPVIADDTALVRGKVGRRQSFTGEPKTAPFFLFRVGLAGLVLLEILGILE